MKTVADKRLFWFLKEGAEFDLSNKNHMDMYVQMILTRGRTQDIKKLLQMTKHKYFIESFDRVKNFLPQGVRRFWEEWIGDFDKPAKKDTHPI